jgi:phage FluMu protein gp41
MATITIKLRDGLTIGNDKHTEAEIREFTAGDIMDASAAAEKIVPTESGPVFVTSPTLMDMQLLCRQIVRIGEHRGPLLLAELRMISGYDLAKIQMAAAALDAGAAKEAATRGRLDNGQGIN